MIMRLSIISVILIEIQIQSLFHEGYEVKEEYKRLFKDYKSRYSPLNLEEITYFFSEHLEVKDPLSELKIKEKLKSVKNIINSNLSIILIQSKNCGLEAKYKTQIKMLSMRSEILSKEIQRINPIYNAVIIRKFVKLLEEKLLSTFIVFFDVENFYPKIDILNKYKERVYKLEFNEKNDCINKIDKLLKTANKLKKNENEKIIPKIKYLANNNITKIEKVFNRIIIYCDSIIHFDSNKGFSFNLDKSIFKGKIIKLDESMEEVNAITTETKEKGESYIVNVSSIVDYISHANFPNEVLNKLSKLKGESNTEIKSPFYLLQYDESYKKLNLFNAYEKNKQDIFINNEFVQNLMSKIKIPKFVENFKKNEIKNIIDYINTNKYDYKEIILTDLEKK